MSYREPQFITPPGEEELEYPYRRAFRSIGMETGLLFAITITLVIAAQFIQFPQNLWLYISLILTLVPALLWAALSWGREFFATEPRHQVMTVFILTMLVANAIGYPLVHNIIEVNQWANRQELLNRIIIFTLAHGIVAEVLKYLVLRYTVWNRNFRNPYDAVAYGAATAIGYATVINLHYVFEFAPPPDIAAIRIFGVTALHTMSSLIVAYALAEMRFNQSSPLLTPAMISLASLTTGLLYALRGNISNTQLSSLVQVSQPRLLFNLIISALAVLGVTLAMAFLFNTAERQAQEVEREPAG